MDIKSFREKFDTILNSLRLEDKNYSSNVKKIGSNISYRYDIEKNGSKKDISCDFILKDKFEFIYKEEIIKGKKYKNLYIELLNLENYQTIYSDQCKNTEVNEKNFWINLYKELKRNKVF